MKNPDGLKSEIRRDAQNDQKQPFDHSMIL